MKPSLFSLIRFFASNWKTFLTILTVASDAVIEQNRKRSKSATKRESAFDLVREVVPDKVGDNWVNLGIELSLALLRTKGVVQ
jgi:hypothetical protein